MSQYLVVRVLFFLQGTYHGINPWQEPFLPDIGGLAMENIYESIWEEEPVADSAIMVHIKNIRKKLGDNSRNPKYIKTAWGKGYYVE